MTIWIRDTLILFLSTPSSQRATCRHHSFCVLKYHFYPRPLRRGRRKDSCICRTGRRFLSTPSSQRATSAARRSSIGSEVISIHALFAEGDINGGRSCRPLFQFLSTPSSQRATCAVSHSVSFISFLSTPSSQRATKYSLVGRGDPSCISIHALFAEGDRLLVSCLTLV